MSSSPLIESIPESAKKTGEVAGDFAFPWRPDKGNGTFFNPVLHADYSDPDVIRVGEDFYLTASSFNCTPGLPILHSKDLINWRIIGHALKNLPHERYDQVQPGCGVWAPAIRFQAGKYWIFFPMPDEGIFLVTADDPAGPWSEPHCVLAGKGLIDPCPLWDDDGKAYLVHAYAGSRAGIKHRLRVCPMTTDGRKILDEGLIVFHEPGKHPTLEGPKFYKRDGWYYIFAPAGGVEAGWQVVLRSKHIYGPYEDKTVLAQGKTEINGPHQGGLVETVRGDWWFLHFQDAGVYGRIVHLQPVKWKDGWPMMGQHGEPVPRHAKPILTSGQKPMAPQTSDEFDECKLGLQWQWHANHRDDWYSLASRPGRLRLHPQLATARLNEQPNLLLQKFPARSFTVETVLEFVPVQFGEEAGLVISGQTAIALGIQHEGSKNQVIFHNDDGQEILFETMENSLTVRVEIQDGGICCFSYIRNYNWVSLPLRVQVHKGVWIGAKLGLYSRKKLVNSAAGHVDVDYFRFL